MVFVRALGPTPLEKADGPNVSRFAQDSQPNDFIPQPAEAMAKRDRRGASGSEL